MLSKLNAGLVRLAEWLTMLAIAAIAIVVPLEVFNRYVLSEMSTWSSEFCQYMLVCASMMGGAAGLRKGYQVGITTLLEKLGPAAARALQGVIYAIVLLLCGVMAYNGGVQTAANWQQTSSSMGISMSIPYASMPLGFGIMFCVTLEQLLDLLSGRTPSAQPQEA